MLCSHYSGREIKADMKKTASAVLSVCLQNHLLVA